MWTTSDAYSQNASQVISHLRRILARRITDDNLQKKTKKEKPWSGSLYTIKPCLH
jgi:hypothetical protein